MYDKYLSELGAADASDAILAVVAYCPITDLENADKANEFVFGGLPADGQALTADRYRDHLLAAYLQLAAATYLTRLSGQDRSTSLSTKPLDPMRRRQGDLHLRRLPDPPGSRRNTEPAFDAFDLSAGEHRVRHRVHQRPALHRLQQGKDTSGAAGAGLDSGHPGAAPADEPDVLHRPEEPEPRQELLPPRRHQRRRSFSATSPQACTTSVTTSTR